jgi:hypothetical protein
VHASVDDVVSRHLSASGSAPHHFGARLEDFRRDLASLLHSATPSGHFTERVRDAALVIWRTPLSGGEGDDVAVP